MENNNIENNLFFEYYALFLTICMIPSFYIFVDEDVYSLAIRLGILLFFIYFLPFIKRDINFVGGLYCGAIFIGFIFHKLSGLDVKLFAEALIRIVPVLLILHYQRDTECSKVLIRRFALIFFVLECVIAIYERMTLTHLIDYKSDTQAMNVTMYLSEEFRSFSLLGHPLWNANIISVMLAFILCSSSLNLFPKLILVLLGLGAIWSFNSRAALLVWLLLIFYRLFLYGKSIKWWISCIAALLIALPYLFTYIEKTGVLGRLDFDFSDGSSLTRLMAFEIFLSNPWSIRDMIMGGTLLEMPAYGNDAGVAAYVLIENGYLLDLGYWGFLLGTIKILGEIILSYQALRCFHVKDKLIIMIAMWGIASMNNNTHFTFLMPFYMCSLLAFGFNQDNCDIPKTVTNEPCLSSET